MTQKLTRALGLLSVVFLSLGLVTSAKSAVSITLSSPTLASDGKTLTAVIGGGSGGYTPASGITGLTIKEGSTPVALLSAAVSGTTLTIVSACFIPSGAAVTLTIATTSNLTDSSADTPVGQSAIATTNSSTLTATTFSAATGITFFGRVNNGNASYWQMLGIGSEGHFLVSGTSANIAINSNVGTTPLTVTISNTDGSSPVTTTPTNTAGSDCIVPLFSGMADGAKLIVIKNTANVYVRLTGALQIMGAAPSFSAVTPSTGAGYGPYVIASATPFANFATMGSFVPLSSNTDNYSNTFISRNSSRWSDAQSRINGRGTLWIWTRFNGTKWRVEVDGSTALVTSANTLKYGFLSLGTTSNTSADHQFLVTEVGNMSTNSGDSDTYLDAVMFTGTGAAVGTSAPAAQLSACAFGDSITDGRPGTEGSTPNTQYDGDSSLSWFYRTCRTLGLTPYNRGITTSKLASAGVDSGGYVRYTADVLGLPVVPKIVTFLYGSNDIGSDLPTFQTRANSTLLGIANGLPASSTIIVMAIIPRISNDPTNYNAALVSAVSYANTNKAANTAAITYLDTAPELLAGSSLTDFSVNYNPLDSIHPNAAGSAVMASWLIPRLSSPSYLVTGGSLAGGVGSASASFTLTTTASAFSTGQSVTVSAPSGSFSVTAAGGTITGNNSASVSVAPVTGTRGAVGASSFSFTYSPASGGTKPITFSNGQSWVNPAALNYVVQGVFFRRFLLGLGRIGSRSGQ